MASLTSDLKKVESLVKTYKYDCLKLKFRQLDFDYYSKYEPQKVELIAKIKDDISFLTNQNSNTKRCLDLLPENDYKFISEIYYNFKEYRDILPLMRSILKTKASDQTVREYCTKYKKQILIKLFELNILGAIDK